MKKQPGYFEKVYDITRCIPPGRVTSYGAIADYLALGSARMVGWALRNALLWIDDIPAHRVVNRNGELTGRMHFDTPETMQQLLEMEGVAVVDHQVVHFKELFWHPEELDSA